MTKFVRVMVFPARVAFSDGTVHTDVKAVVTDDEMYLYGSNMHGVTIIYRGDLIDAERTERAGYNITLEGGITASIMRDGGCGCGSRLRSYNPFPGLPMEGWK